MSSIHIREALPDDAEAIRDVQRRTWLATYPNEALGITRADIEARFYEDPATAEARRERRGQSLCTPPYRAWVALDEADVIGFCIVKQDDRENMIEALYVLPDVQGNGIGKWLLQTAIGWLGADNGITLGIASYNEKAIAFYRAFGFASDDSVAPTEAFQLPSGASIPEIKMVRNPG